MIDLSQIFLRLLIAAALGAVVGFERERQNQPAGLRTHIILAIGSALAMILSVSLPQLYPNQAGSADPARLAAQVVSGIGFLGAGAILRFGTNIKGLTTATSLWTVAIVGLTVGAGMYLPAAGTIVLLLVSLSLLNILEKRMIRSLTDWTVTLEAIDHPGLQGEFHRIVHLLDQRVKSVGFSKNIPENILTIEATIQTMENENVDRLVESLSALPGARNVTVHS